MTSSPELAAILQRAPVQEDLGVIFPGQGSQRVGMGRDLVEISGRARQVFALADQVLDMQLSTLCFEGPVDELTKTANAQPAILATSLACLAAAFEIGTLRSRPALLAGHSLGEYTALVAAGSLRIEDALVLVRQRGRVMSEAGELRPGTMVAVLGLSEQDVQEICRLSGAEPCNYNAPTQIVLGGPPSVIEHASRLAKDRGGKVLPLNVSGAFHTSLMGDVMTPFAAMVDEIEILDPLIPVVSNVTALPLHSAKAVGEDLKRQMQSPVRWYQSIESMINSGIGAFVEVGPGRVLTALLKRIAPQATAVSIDGAAALTSPTNV